jgi:hypothetical protein
VGREMSLTVLEKHPSALNPGNINLNNNSYELFHIEYLVVKVNKCDSCETTMSFIMRKIYFREIKIKK